MSSITYGLRPEYADTYGGGNVNIGGSPFDVAAALSAGHGQIKVDETDTVATTVLDGYAPLQRVTDKKSTTTKKSAKAGKGGA